MTSASIEFKSVLADDKSACSLFWWHINDWGYFAILPWEFAIKHRSSVDTPTRPTMVFIRPIDFLIPFHITCFDIPTP